jgi:hypothetical protein
MEFEHVCRFDAKDVWTLMVFHPKATVRANYRAQMLLPRHSREFLGNFMGGADVQIPNTLTTLTSFSHD